jgi:REP element-mobilizing transposase RayT
MNSNPKKQNRKTLRLKEYDYSFPGWYYITICTKDRRYLFGKIINGKMILNNSGEIVEEEWLKTKKIRTYVDIDYYVIMPNHFHGIIIIEQSNDNVGATRRVALNNEERAIQRIAPTKQTLISNSLGSIIGQFKSRVTKKLRTISDDTKLKIWQRNYYEHIIRNELDLHNIRQYIEDNPHHPVR